MNSIAMKGFKKVDFANGSFSLQDLENQQVMHSAIGPETEAMTVYAEPALAWVRLNATGKPLTLFDVGLGTASNVTVFLKVLAEARLSSNVSVISFETKPEGLRAALNLNMSHLKGFEDPLQKLLKDGHARFYIGELSIEWSLLVGPIENTLPKVLATADLVFFDLYSPRNDASDWSIELFKQLRSKMNPVSLLITYAAAGWVKRNLKEAGFKVVSGPGTPMKRETTHATNR